MGTFMAGGSINNINTALQGRLGGMIIETGG